MRTRHQFLILFTLFLLLFWLPFLGLIEKRSILVAATPASQPTMISIPGGAFAMGDHYGYVDPSHPSDEIPIHTVSISSFKMGQNDITVEQYCAFLGIAYSSATIQVVSGLVYLVGGSDVLFQTRQADQYSRIGWNGTGFSVLDNKNEHPITSVMWHGAAAYCNWLSTSQGLQPCYNTTTWNCDFVNNGYRLPTEAEWEYAARGGQYSPYFNYIYGNQVDKTKSNIPNSGDPYESGSLPWTTPVGFYNGQLQLKSVSNWPGNQSSYQTSNGANGYGLYDMAGNVWQWCNDWYGQNYYNVSSNYDPKGPASGTPMPDGKPYHVLRGGNWYNGDDGHSRVSNRDPAYYRGPQDPNHPYYHVGFRVVQRDGKNLSIPGQTVGLFINTASAWQGYTLLAPKHYTSTYLINNEGQVVHSWNGSKYEPGQSAYLLENGNLIRAAMTKGPLSTGGGEGGRIEEYNWNGALVWEFDYSTDMYMSHHDFRPLPNGNLLLLAVEKKTYDQAIAAGFDPSKLSADIKSKGFMLPDSVVEVKPTRPVGGTVVWEWHVWDHLIQDFNASKANYGNVASHPELIDADGTGNQIPLFWNHMNSINYNAELDQIVLSVRGNSEIWVIDHNTTLVEASGHSGGRSGKGGDLLYRWGNPLAYKAGSVSSQMLFQQHDAQWIESNCPGAGNILVFNNGLGRLYSSVDEFTPPIVDSNGNYPLVLGAAFGPTSLTWTYKANPSTTLYSEAISGAQRLPNGNTLICDGVHGVLIEVTPSGETCWKYVNPVVKEGPLTQGSSPALDDRGHQMNAVFRVERYPLDYIGLKDRDLTPGTPLEGYAIPQLNHITIIPSSKILQIGSTQQFSAQGYDQNNNAILGLDFSWTVTGVIGSVNPTSGQTTTFTGSTAGSGSLSATTTYQGITKSGSASITVTTTSPPPDTMPPTINHTPISTANDGKTITISATITDDAAVAEAKLHYRKGGETTYTSVAMTPSGNTYTGTIPASMATTAGVQYYINATDGTNFSTHPSTNPTTSPHAITVILLNIPPTAATLKIPSDITQNSMKLAWTQNTEADFARYEIYQSLNSGALGTKIHTIADRSIASFTVTDLSADTTYYFTIRVVDTADLFADSVQVSERTTPSATPAKAESTPPWTWWVVGGLVAISAALTISILVFRQRKKLAKKN